MALPARFDKHMKRSFGARAVWQPGQPVSLGTICVKDGGIFRPIDHIDSFGGTFTAKAFTDKSVSLQSSAVRQVIIQAGAELPSADALDLTAKATVKFTFEKEEQYVLKTPQLQGQVIDKVAQLTKKMAKHKDWKHSKFAIVCEIFHARDFTFSRPRASRAASSSRATARTSSNF